MKDISAVALVCAPSIICMLGAVYCIVNGISDGWGWLLFIGCIVMPNKVKTK